MKKAVLTSGEVARYCGVTLRTAIRWIEKGHLKAYKLPGRGNNRVQFEDFISFLKQHDMPIPDGLKEENRRILVVDDNEKMARSIVRVLKKHGYECKMVHDGFQAGVELASFKPVLLVLDLMMPKMNGFQVIQFIRNSDFSSVKIVVLSGAGDSALEQALNSGADVALDKPFENKELITVINTLIEREALKPD